MTFMLLKYNITKPPFQSIDSFWKSFIAHLSWSLSELSWSPVVRRLSVRLSIRSSVRPSVNFSHFHLLLQNRWTNFNQTWHKASLGEGIHVNSNEGSRRFPRGDNNEIAKIHWRNLKFFFSRTTEPMSTKLGTKHPWMIEIQVCSNEEPINSH